MILAFFSVSPLEILILMGIGLFVLLGIAVPIILVVLLTGRKKTRTVDYDSLEEENARLREEVDRLQKNTGIREP